MGGRWLFGTHEHLAISECSGRFITVKCKNKILEYKNKCVRVVDLGLGLGPRNLCFIFLHHKILNVLFFGGQLCTLSGCLDARAVFRFVVESKHRNSHYFYLYSHKHYI